MFSPAPGGSPLCQCRHHHPHPGLGGRLTLTGGQTLPRNLRHAHQIRKPHQPPLWPQRRVSEKTFGLLCCTKAAKILHLQLFRVFLEVCSHLWRASVQHVLCIKKTALNLAINSCVSEETAQTELDTSRLGPRAPRVINWIMSSSLCGSRQSFPNRGPPGSTVLQMVFIWTARQHLLRQ